MRGGWMARGGGLGREFRWLWTAYTVSAFGTRLSFDAFPLIAVLVLHVGPAQVSALAAVGLAVGAAVAVPLGPWVEFRRKRPVMTAMDLVRCAALLTVPAAYALGLLTFSQLLLVSVVVAVADITFTAASGAFLKSLVPAEHLVAANGRFEATTWTTTMLGPPLGGAAMGLFGPVVTLLIDAGSYLLSAAGIRAIGDVGDVSGREPRPAGTAQPAHAVAPTATGTFTGDPVDTPYGTVQVAATLARGRITSVKVLQAPDHNGRDRQIASYALPRLTREALGAQSAHIDAVSGASYTSQGYVQSLQSALDRADA